MLDIDNVPNTTLHSKIQNIHRYIVNENTYMSKRCDLSASLEYVR